MSQNGDHGKEEASSPPVVHHSGFKAEIVELCRRGDRSIGQVARDFDLTETNVRTWVKQAEIDQGQRPGLTTEEREELARLRRENQRLEIDNETLKRAQLYSLSCSHLLARWVGSFLRCPALVVTVPCCPAHRAREG
jgi:transposase